MADETNPRVEQAEPREDDPTYEAPSFEVLGGVADLTPANEDSRVDAIGFK